VIHPHCAFSKLNPQYSATRICCFYMFMLFRCTCTSKHFISDHMFYINSVHENVVNFEMSYHILQLFVKILYFLMYSPIMVINVAEACSC